MKDPHADEVRIDGHGTAHPIGAAASRALRARTGSYRVLAAPLHVVLLRRSEPTGAGAELTENTGPLRLAGEITAAGTLCDVLALIAQSQWRGELLLFDAAHTRSVFIDRGNVIGATTAVESERLGSVLYRYGAITEEQRAELVDGGAGGRRVGERALELNFLKEDRLYAYIGRQIEEIVFGALTVSTGTFFFLDGFDERRLVSRHTLSLNALLMEGVTRLDELRYFCQRVPSPGHIPVKTNRGTLPPRELLPVYEQVDGEHSVAELGRLTGIGEFETTKALYALSQSQHITVAPPRASGGPTAVVQAANRALRTLFSAASAAGKAGDLQQVLASFAAGAGVYDILFHGAGPDATGALNAERIVQNSRIVAGGDSPDNVLRQLLHEYVSFALFSLGTHLGAEIEAELTEQLAPTLAELRPHG